MRNFIFYVFTLLIISCKSDIKTSDVIVTSAMRNVMWKGELEGKIRLDSIKNKNGLYGLGPEAYLTGEILINDGATYVSKVLTDSTIHVIKTSNTEAPFFVHSNVTEWDKLVLPKNIKTISDLEQFIENKTSNTKRPFAFKLIGRISNAVIHIQNLPSGTKVSSPKEAHQGQVDYNLKNENVEIIGFFSKEHQGIFTHHDSFLHMHLITEDETKMGHLDSIDIDEMTLFLPKS